MYVCQIANMTCFSLPLLGLLVSTFLFILWYLIRHFCFRFLFILSGNRWLRSTFWIYKDEGFVQSYFSCLIFWRGGGGKWDSYFFSFLFSSSYSFPSFCTDEPTWCSITGVHGILVRTLTLPFLGLCHFSYLVDMFYQVGKSENISFYIEELTPCSVTGAHGTAVYPSSLFSGLFLSFLVWILASRYVSFLFQLVFSSLSSLFFSSSFFHFFFPTQMENYIATL